jgi:hypothetical protein
MWLRYRTGMGRCTFLLSSGALCRARCLTGGDRAIVAGHGPECRHYSSIWHSTVNDSQPVPWPDFDSALRQKLAHYPPHWPIYLDGDPNMEWKYAAEVIGTIRGQGAEVILLARPPAKAKMRDH